jgi:ribosomal protein S18 acetylase RimI-like enzyme
MTQTSGGTRTVRPFVRADLSATVVMLARAFAEDPVMTWIFPDEWMRRRRLPSFFASSLRGTIRHGGTEVAVLEEPGLCGPVLGAALWLPPDTWRPPLWRQFLALPGVALRLGSRLPVASSTFGALVRVHPAKPHWYLSGIGTDPPAQGTGVGGELMRSRLGRCDADRLPAYLESGNERNVPFYERHGFGVIGELSIPDGGPMLWLMWRDPQDGPG